MPVKTRGTKTSPWGLLSSQRLPLILLAVLTLYRMCINPNKSFHLLCLMHESLTSFWCFSCTNSQLVGLKKKGSYCLFSKCNETFFQDVNILNTIHISKEVVSPQISLHRSFPRGWLILAHSFCKLQCLSQLGLSPATGATPGNTKMERPRTPQKCHPIQIQYLIPLGTRARHSLKAEHAMQGLLPAGSFHQQPPS